LVDDCSQDDTLIELKKIKDKRVQVHYKHSNQGKGAALKSGCRLVNPKSQYIIFLDADLQIDPSDITTFLNTMNLYNANAVIGNKKHIYSNIEYSLIRKVLSGGYRLLIKLLFGLPLQDTQCGFKLFKTETLLRIMPKITCKCFAFDLELLVALKVNNFRVVDAPVYLNYSEKSTVNRKDIFEMFMDTLAVWWRKKRKKYKI
jgi:glycosyltransferase involved in cell wall biosynthesis